MFHNWLPSNRCQYIQCFQSVTRTRHFLARAYIFMEAFIDVCTTDVQPISGHPPPYLTEITDNEAPLGVTKHFHLSNTFTFQVQLSNHKKCYMNEKCQSGDWIYIRVQQVVIRTMPVRDWKANQRRWISMSVRTGSELDQHEEHSHLQWWRQHSAVRGDSQ